jgi:DNA-binding CsgD family transcriptional regulator
VTVHLREVLLTQGLANSEASEFPIALAPTARHGELDVRARAVGEEAQSNSEPLPLASLWRALTDGTVTALDEFCTERRCYFIVKQGEDRRRYLHALSARSIRLLSLILQGRMQKAVAIELNLAPATVTMAASRCLEAMGFECTATYAPAFLVMAAYAHLNGRPEIMARSTLFHCGTRKGWIVSAERPDRTPLPVLSRAEHAVVRLAVEGRTSLQIAAARGTSVHTISNQLARVFEKLAVGNRSQLLWRVVVHAHDLISSDNAQSSTSRCLHELLGPAVN